MKRQNRKGVLLPQCQLNSDKNTDLSYNHLVELFKQLFMAFRCSNDVFHIFFLKHLEAHIPATQLNGT